MKNWIWLVIGVILLLEILFNSEAVPVRNMRNTAPDGVVLDSVNVLPGTNMLLSQEGKTVSITCKQSSSTTTGVHFQLQVNIGTGGSWTPLPLTSSKPVWKIVPKNGKQYKCVATNSKGTKESQIYQSDVISIKIHENPCKVAQFKSLACTCNATSKIGNPKIKVKWYADGYQEGIKDFSTIPPGVNTPVKDGVINRNKMDYRNLIYSTLTQCRLWKYNGIELPKPLQNQILHQTKMDVTYFPAEIQTRDTFTGEPDIRNQGEVVEYICRTLGGRPDPTVIYQQKRRGSEQWEPIPDPQPRKVPLKGGLKGFDTTYKFKADFTLHNGTSFRCAVKKNLTFPEPRQFNPIIVHSPDGVVLNSVNVLPGTNMLLSQEGKTVSITCKQSNTAASGVHFQLQASGAGETWIPLHLISSKPVWKILPEAGKQYKCVATNSAGTKESQIYKSDVISIQINENPCKVAEFQSLACTCEATSKIGNPNIAVKWYADAYTEGVTEFYPIHKQGVTTPEKDGIVNRNQMDYRNLIYATLIQCQLRRYNGLVLPRPLQNQILHQTRMDVTSPDAVVLNSVNVLPGTRVLLSQEGKTVSITCKQSSSTATGVHFELQVKSGGTWTLIPTTSAPAWVFKLEAGKEYKCVATNSAGTKESQIYKSDVISIKINENPCKVAEFQSLTCTCEATSKIGNQNMAVKWYSDGFTNGSTDFDMMHDQGVNTPVKDGVINRNHMQFKFMIYAKSIQCSLWRYNGLILPRPLQNQILHQTRMDVTSPDAVVLNSVNVLPGTNILLSQEGKTVSITCKQSSSTTTDVHFQLHVNSGAGGAWTPLPLGISTVWVFKLEPGKQYKCVATNSAGTKESQIYISDVISIGINENPCKVAQFQSLSCTCEATSKIGNQNIKVKWYADGFTEGSTDIVNIHEQGVNTAVKDGVINRNQMDYRYMIYATLIQCQLRRYNGLILPRPLQNQILHQTKMDVTYFPDEIQTQGNLTGQPDIRTEGEVVKYICRTEGGRPDPTVIYQQKRRGSEQWQPIPDPQPRKVPRKGHLKGFDTTYKFKADFKLHNGTSFRCAVKENLTFPEPRQFNPIVVHYFAPVYKKSSENETHAAYNVTVNSNPLTQQVTCDPPAVVQKLSNYQWNITIPIVNSTTTDYRGRCLADGINERVIDVAGYHNAGPTDEPVLDHGGGSVAGAVIGILLILLILIILFILWRHDCLRCRKPDDQLCRCGNLPRLGPKPEDVNELLRWTSETWYEKDHENWMKTRDQLQPEIVRIIGDVYETENDWEITRDKDKQAIAIREYLFQRLSHDQSMLDLVKEILRKYFRIKNLKMKLSNEIDTLLNEKRSIDGADAVYNRDEDEVHVSLSDKSNEEKRPLTNKEKEFIKNVGSAVESIVDYFAKMSDAELCERGIANIKPTVEIAEKFVKETLNKEVKQQNENLVRQIDKKKVSDETQKEMGVADQYRFSNKDVCESVLSESSLQILEENNSTELDKSIYKISRNVLEIKLKIAVIESTKELYAGRAERFLKELEEKLKQEENEERKNEEELNRIIHSSVCQAFKYITDMNEKTLMDNKVVGYGVSPEEINSELHELADKEFEDRKWEEVGLFNRIKTPEEILPLKLNIPAQLRTDLNSAGRDQVILSDRSVEYFKDEFIIAIQSDESLKTATQTALDNKSSYINDLLKENSKVVDRIYGDVKNKIKSMSTEELKERGIVAYRIKDGIALKHIKPIIENRIPGFKDSLVTVLKEKCKKALSMWPLKHWEYDISTALSVLSEFTSRTLNTNTGYWKQVKECFGDEIDSETNTTELTEIVHECLDECAKKMCDEWSSDDFKNNKMMTVSQEEINAKLHELADKEFEERKRERVKLLRKEKKPEEILPLKLNIPAQLRTELYSAGRDPVILWDRAVEYFKDEFIIAIQSDESLKAATRNALDNMEYFKDEFISAIQSDESLKTATQTALDNKSSEINNLLKKENSKVVDRIYNDVKSRIQSISTEELNERKIVVYRIKDETAMKNIKLIIANRIPGFKDSLVTVLKEKCKKARSMWSSKHWTYDISTAMSELSEFTSQTLKTDTGYWKQVKECFGDEINSETNTTKLTKIVDECLSECTKIMNHKWNTDDFKKDKMIVDSEEIVEAIKRKYFQTPEFKRSVETAVNEAIQNSEKSQHGKKPCYEYAVKWIADEMKGFTVKPSETFERNEFARLVQPIVMKRSREWMDEICAITDKKKLKDLGFLVDDDSKVTRPSNETAASDGQSAADDSHTSDTVSSGDREQGERGTQV